MRKKRFPFSSYLEGKGRKGYALSVLEKEKKKKRVYPCREERGENRSVRGEEVRLVLAKRGKVSRDELSREKKAGYMVLQKEKTQTRLRQKGSLWKKVRDRRTAGGEGKGLSEARKKRGIAGMTWGGGLRLHWGKKKKEGGFSSEA